MDSLPDGAPEPVVLIIADISGYTRYMTANAKTLAHSQAIITELLKTILQQIELPLEVAELEGDAVFLFCRTRSVPRWEETKRLIGEKVLTLFHLFREKVLELSRSTMCTCTACRHIEKLQLKIIIHRGEALFSRVLNFVKPVGVDVIIVHRLLKNSVQASQYLLLTEAASRELSFPGSMSFQSSVETYEEIGSIKTVYHDFDFAASDDRPKAKPSFGVRYRESLRLFVKLWFRPLRSSGGKFRNLPNVSGRVARVAFAVLTVLATPLFVPVGAVLVVFHVMQGGGSDQMGVR